MKKYLSNLEEIFNEEVLKFKDLADVECCINLHSINAPINDYLYELYLYCDGEEYSVFIKECYFDTTEKQHKRFNDILERLLDIKNGKLSVNSHTMMYSLHNYMDILGYVNKKLITLEEFLGFTKIRFAGLTIKDIIFNNKNKIIDLGGNKYINFFDCMYFIS